MLLIQTYKDRSIYWICSSLTAPGNGFKIFLSLFSTLGPILLNSEEVDEPPVAASVLLDLAPLLHPPPPLVRQLEHVLVDVAVLLHDLRVLLGHHVDHNATGLAQPGHRGKAEKKLRF